MLVRSSVIAPCYGGWLHSRTYFPPQGGTMETFLRMAAVFAPHVIGAGAN